jgi:putative addiction module component (TIGR02574 family)
MSLSPAAAEVLRQLMELPAEEREAVVAAVWEAEIELSPELEAELDRREAAVAAGEMKTFSMEEVDARARERLEEFRRQREPSMVGSLLP